MTARWQLQVLEELAVGVGWDAGIARKGMPNEDSLVAFQGSCIYNARLAPFGLFMVADGMGGHEKGQDASYLAVRTILKWLLPGIVGSDKMDEDSLIKLLAQAVQQANLAIYKRNQEMKVGMGTTIIAVVVMDA